MTGLGSKRPSKKRNHLCFLYEAKIRGGKIRRERLGGGGLPEITIALSYNQSLRRKEIASKNSKCTAILGLVKREE